MARPPASRRWPGGFTSPFQRLAAVASLPQEPRLRAGGTPKIPSQHAKSRELTATMALRAEILLRASPKLLSRIDARSRRRLWRSRSIGDIPHPRRVGCGRDGDRAWSSGVRIPKAILDAVPLGLTAIPLEFDYRTEMVLPKAHGFADGWNVDFPELVCRFKPEWNCTTEPGFRRLVLLVALERAESVREMTNRFADTLKSAVR